MKKSKWMQRLLTLALAGTLLCGFGNGVSASGQTDPETTSLADSEESTTITLLDQAGREVTLDETASRIIALAPADVEILIALGAEDTIVGRGEYTDIPEVQDVPTIESGSTLNIEQIIALEPQVLLVLPYVQNSGQLEILEKAGIKVVVCDAQNIEDVYETVNMLGTLVGKTSEAETVVSDMKNAFAELQEKAAGDGSESVYFEVSPLEYGLWASGSGTFMDEIAKLLGLSNAFGDVEGWAEISEEQVIERAPDYIVTISLNTGDDKSSIEEIMGRKGWENIPAIKNNKIMCLQNDELSRPSPRLIDGAQLLFDFVYGSEE